MPHFPKPYFRKSRGFWYVQIDGRQINLGRDRDDAFQQYHRLMGESRQRHVASGSLVGVIDAFLEWAERNRSPDTYEWYRYRLQRFIEKHPDLRASDLRPYHVETWANGYDLSGTSRRNYLRSVKRCLKWAKKQGYIDRNPIEDLEVPVAEHREVAITREGFDEFLGFVRNESFRDLVSVTWETGCRPQESLRVEARHVDLQNQRWVFRKSESKMKRITRVIYLTDTALAITRRLMLAHPEGPLFRNTNGKPWNPEATNCAFDAVQVRMGKAEMQRHGEKIPEESIAAAVKKLAKTRIRNCKRRSESAARIGLTVQRSGLKPSIVIGLEGD